ncbi:fungal-specific transcription factor domain-containing protein [Mycena floridula]|nr:fungal-specific transcription factor domain-containing protein [Mycena floridula]
MPTNDENKSTNPRACQSCRKKKGKCDVDNKFPRCTNCVQANKDCTFIRKHRPNKAYVDDLEKRTATIEMYLRKLIPHADIDNLIANVTDAVEEEEEEAHLIATYRKDFEKWTSFYVKSSEHATPAVLEIFLDMKGIMTGAGKDGEAAVRQKEAFVKHRLRTEFWNPRPWETFCIPQRPVYEFPPDDLMASLIQLYFAHSNIFLPLLHRPTFERRIAEGEHLDVSSTFGTVVMLVMAVASRFSDDPRVLAPGHDSPLSSGWKWFAPVRPVLYGLFDCYTPTTSLYDLQAIFLSVIFSLSTSSAGAPAWSHLGIALRAAQDIGAHRKKPKCNQGDPVTEELLKRAWWLLVCMDIISSSSMGKPCMISREELSHFYMVCTNCLPIHCSFDVDLPIECDDEYWEHPDPAKAFQQPVDKPSKVTSFICFIQIMDLMATAVRKLYCINTPRNISKSTSAEWREKNVASLDSAFNLWLDTVPKHIRWDPQNPDPIFFAQSVQIYCSFYHLRILVHRSILPKPGKTSPQSSGSLAICTNAARSCSHAVDIYYRRTGLGIDFALPFVFTAGIVLLLEMWAAESAGLRLTMHDRMTDFQKCLDALERTEKRWASAGRFRHLLLGLAIFEENAPHNDTLSQNKAPIEPSLPVDALAEIPGVWPIITMDAETDQLLNILSDTSSWYEPGDRYNPTSDTMSVFPSSSESQSVPFPEEWTDPMYISSHYPSLDDLEIQT